MTSVLTGKRVLLTRGVEDNRAWAALLRERGIEPLTLTCLETRPLPEAAPALAEELAACEWMALASRRAAEAVAELYPKPLPARVRVACVGPQTAAAATDRLGRVDRVAPLGTGRSLGAELAATLPRWTRLLVAAAEEGRVDLEDVLRPVGIDVRRVAVYRTTPTERDGPPLRLAELAPDAIFLASPSAVRGLVNQALVPTGARVIALGPTTAEAAREAGLRVDGEARTRGLDGLCEALAQDLKIHDPASER